MPEVKDLPSAPASACWHGHAVPGSAHLCHVLGQVARHATFDVSLSASSFPGSASCLVQGLSEAAAQLSRAPAVACYDDNVIIRLLSSCGIWRAVSIEVLMSL